MKSPALDEIGAKLNAMLRGLSGASSAPIAVADFGITQIDYCTVRVFVECAGGVRISIDFDPLVVMIDSDLFLHTACGDVAH
jgi:hypothetical protein